MPEHGCHAQRDTADRQPAQIALVKVEQHEQDATAKAAPAPVGKAPVPAPKAAAKAAPASKVAGKK